MQIYNFLPIYALPKCVLSYFKAAFFILSTYKVEVKMCVKSLRKNASLDTLAQNGTNLDFDVQISANTNVSNKQNLLKRARRKYLSNGLILALVDAAKDNLDSTLQKSYWNSYHCARTLQLSTDDKIKGSYCKNRWCMVCNAIRTAQAINNYSPTIKTWDAPHFTTLTAETVDGDDLSDRLDLMQVVMRETKEIHKQRKRRNKIDFDFKGIRKTECTYNWRTKKYHPHQHIITNSFETAQFLQENWMTKMAKRGVKVDIKAQDIRPCDETATIELFKYFTKIVTKLPSGKTKIDGSSLDVIFNAMKGRQTSRPFGFRKAKGLQVANSTKSQVMAVFTWNQLMHDWYDENGQGLTGYVPSSRFTDFASNRQGFEGFEDAIQEAKDAATTINIITTPNKSKILDFA